MVDRQLGRRVRRRILGEGFAVQGGRDDPGEK
jgi:hypothetical protein